jgi:exosome complex component RRP45
MLGPSKVNNTLKVYTMPREAEPSLNEKQFFAKALQENIRLDGRSPDKFRHLELDFGGYGVTDVRLGETR